MAYERTWQFAPSFQDYVPASALDGARHKLWSYKSFLKGEIGGATQGLWTCEGSSDGVTAAMDGVDRWGTVYDGSLIVRGNTGAARSWIVLKSPGLMNGTYWYILLTFGNSTLDYIASFHHSSSAYTGGSTTTNPASTYDTNGNSATAPDTATCQMVNHSYPTTRLKCHGILSSTGDFIIMGVRQGAIYGNDTGFMFIAPIGCSGSDQWPIYAAHRYGVPNNVDAFAGYPLNSTVAGNCVVRSHDKTLTSSPTQALPSLPSWQGGDSLSGKLIDTPAWVMVKVATTGFSRGRLPDMGMWQTSVAGTPTVANGSTVRDGGSNITHIVCGGLLIPFNSVPDFS